MRGSYLNERLAALLAAPIHGEGALSVDQVEHTLTDGYAYALELDAERARLARRIGVLAARDGGDTEEWARELSSLSQRLADTDVELSQLRRSLADVRRRATELRALAAA